MATILKNAGLKALDDLESTIASLTQMLETDFKPLPSEKQKTFIEGYSKDLSNGELKALKSTVEDQTSLTVDLLNNLKMWVNLLIPKIEDGNNFGVSVQMALVKTMNERTKEVGEVFEAISAFHEKRSSLVSEISPKSSKEKVSGEILEAVGDGKKGKESKTTEKVVETTPLQEQYEALASVDVKLYLKLKNAVRTQRDFLVITQDFVSKNEKRIRNPRGNNYSTSYAM